MELLLENMLPPAISKRLRVEGRTFADAFSECSVLFADIVGYTSPSESVPNVVNLLDAIFSRFDDLTEQSRLEKIKTIGDAYMVAAGIPEARSDHATAAADLALQMQAAIKDFPGLEIRIGINSGGSRRRRGRQKALHLRPLGRYGQYRRTHGIAGNIRRHPGERGDARFAAARLRLRG